MTTITLPSEVADRVEQEALRRGVDPSALVTSLIDTALPKPRLSDGNEATLALLAEWAAEDAAMTPEEVERGRVEGEEFMRSLNQNRRDAEGPNARPLWP